ncbi:hypothetical protein GT755_38160 [Herbidospora sp. NEAU-GS84]|uniref:Uncharacterized protein n=1 Tax=Herbidospora solisilvae TaxID=2696284 RepID=A0A7C9K2M8_9ACTN|nr:hypothetical protein [Herbidospora solisilvae]NAS27479.1 hypothetical protein [Herbidospora solisilvae]
MFSLRFRFPGLRAWLIVIVVIFTMTLLHLGYEPEMALMVVGGAITIAISAIKRLDASSSSRRA